MGSSQKISDDVMKAKGAKKLYSKPDIEEDEVFDTLALGCSFSGVGKTPCALPRNS